METCQYCGSGGRHAFTCPQAETARKEARRMFDEFLEEQHAAAEESAENGQRHKPDTGEIRRAKEIVAKFLDGQVYPRVTVKREHLKAILDQGLREMPTAYQKNVKLIVGTLAREPLLPENEDRVILEIRAEPGEVEPRFTGNENAFQGIVRIKGPTVPPERLRVIDPKETEEGGARAA